MQALKRLPGLLQRLDRGLRGVQEVLVQRIKYQALELQEFLAERLG